MTIPDEGLNVSNILAVALFVIILAYLTRKASKFEDGWRGLKPGAAVWVGIIPGVPFLAFLTWQFSLSGPPQGTDQQVSYAILYAGLVVAVLYLSWSVVRIKRLAFQWRSENIRWRKARGEWIQQTFDSISAVRTSWTGMVSINFSDGESVRLDQMTKGMSEFISEVEERRGELFQWQ